MHETDRHRIILSAVQERPVATVQQLCALTGASEATVRRDIAAMHMQKRVRRLRGGCEALHPPPLGGLAGRPFSVNESINLAQKQAIAREAVALCDDGDAIIINGGTTTFQMVHGLATRALQVFTNSFPIAEHLLKHSRNTILLAGGAIYREQNIILDPFGQSMVQKFFARRIFMGAQGIGAMGLMEADPLILQAENALIEQADELVVLVDSSKFERRSSLIVCALEHIDTLITDEALEDRHASMLESAGVRVVTAGVRPEMAPVAAGQH